MEKSGNRSFPKWIYAILATCGLLASGIYMGILSVEGFTTTRIIQAAGFGILGLLMFWGALSRR